MKRIIGIVAGAVLAFGLFGTALAAGPTQFAENPNSPTADPATLENGLQKALAVCDRGVNAASPLYYVSEAGSQWQFYAGTAAAKRAAVTQNIGHIACAIVFEQSAAQDGAQAQRLQEYAANLVTAINNANWLIDAGYLEGPRF